MHPTEALVEIQAADLDVLRAEKRLDSLPEKIAIIETRHKETEISGLLVKARAYEGEVDRAVARAEDEISMITEKMAVEQEKLTSGAISDHKEVTNVSREIDALRRRKEKLEMETVALMEKAEKAAKQVATIEAAIAKLSEREASLIEEFKRAGSAVQDEIAELKKRRAALCTLVDAETMAAYERTRDAKHGIGVGVLADRTCGACGIELPADRLHVLKEGPDVSVCPMCNRLLVVKMPAGDA